MKYQTFTIESRFAFPLDMLRYDSCFPADGQAVTAIINSIRENAKGEVQLARFVKNKRDQPTIARWQSFGCRVSDVSTR